MLRIQVVFAFSVQNQNLYRILQERSLGERDWHLFDDVLVCFVEFLVAHVRYV